MSKLHSVDGHIPPLQWSTGLKDYFFFFFPPDFLPPGDLLAEAFFDEPPPDFFAEDVLPLLLPFLDFCAWGALPPVVAPPCAGPAWGLGLGDGLGDGLGSGLGEGVGSSTTRVRMASPVPPELVAEIVIE